MSWQTFKRVLKMNKYSIEITEPAEHDLKEIVRYIALELRDSIAAQNVIGRISGAIYDLVEMPLRNPLVSDEKLSLQGIRKIIIDNYLVFYVVTEGNRTVTIIRVLYSRRDWINLL